MSTSYHVRCLDCENTCHFDDNYGSGGLDLARQCIGHAAALAAIAPFIEERGFPFGLRYNNHCAIDVGWFAAHAGHKLQPVDAYGRLDDQCYKWVACKGCACSHPCALKREHDGPCSTKGAA